MPAARDIFRPREEKKQADIRPAAAATAVLNPLLSSCMSSPCVCRSKQHVRVTGECMGLCASVLECNADGQVCVMSLSLNGDRA